MRLIDADALEKKLLGCEFETNCLSEECVKEVLKTLRVFIPRIIANEPTVNSEMMKHGRWYMKLAVNAPRYMECSVCRYDFDRMNIYSFKYCPNYGSRMDEGANNG